MSSEQATLPLDSVVYIADTIGELSIQGSGVLISPDEVLTASHVVYNSVEGPASDITVVPDYIAGLSPFGSATGTSFHYNLIQNPGGVITLPESQFDYAVIHLSNSFPELQPMGLQPDFQGGEVGVTGYPAVDNGQPDYSTQIVEPDANYTLLVGMALGEGSSGGPVWDVGSNGSLDVVGLVSGAIGSTGYFTQISTAAFNQIEDWIAQDDAAGLAPPASPPSPTPPPPSPPQPLPPSPSPPPSGVAVLDTTTGGSSDFSPQPYSGPVSGLQNEYIDVTADSLDVSVSTPNWFIHSGSGNDAIAVSSGTDVMDGGTGSNFLTGGSGADTFFVDDRGPSADIWSTVNNFHAGDAATIWGVAPQDFTLTWADGQGAAGYTGLTLHATAPGEPMASLTLVGFSQADLTDGRLSVLFGTDPSSGSAYMSVHENS